MKRWALYAGGGAVVYALKVAATALLVELGGWHFTASYAATIVAVVLFSFWYNRRITFAANGHALDQLRRYLAALAVFYAVDYALAVGMSVGLGLHYPVAITLSTAIIFLAKYPVFRSFVFRAQY
jgi:putative flippase GtrA